MLGCALPARTALAIGSLLAVVLSATFAQAQRVILVCPPETDALLNEAFNRLRGELTMHGFEVEVQTAEEAVSPENLAQRAETSHAVASVSFVRNEGSTTADIKISDRVTGKTSIRTIATPAGTEMASLLALRAVELLRASLREFGSKAEAPRDIVGASPQRADPSVAQWAQASLPQRKPPSPLPPPTSPLLRYHFTLRIDGIAAVQLSDSPASYGLGAALGVNKGHRLETRLVLAAPWFGAKYETRRASAQFHLVSVSGEVAYCIPVGRRLQLQPLLSLGVAHVTTFTNTIYPVTLHTPAPSAWLAMSSIGLGMNVTLSTSWFWNTTARLAVLLPRPVIEIEQQRHTIGAPMAMVSSGIGAEF